MYDEHVFKQKQCDNERILNLARYQLVQDILYQNSTYFIFIDTLEWCLMILCKLVGVAFYFFIITNVFISKDVLTAGWLTSICLYFCTRISLECVTGHKEVIMFTKLNEIYNNSIV